MRQPTKGDRVLRYLEANAAHVTGLDEDLGRQRSQDRFQCDRRLDAPQRRNAGCPAVIISSGPGCIVSEVAPLEAANPIDDAVELMAV